MTKRFRSTFEAMVLDSNISTINVVSSPLTQNTTGRGVYAWMQQLHPSVDSLQPHQHAEDALKRDAENDTTQPPVKIMKRSDPIFHTKFPLEHIFEIVVMYLFNGLNAAHTQNTDDYHDDNEACSLDHPPDVDGGQNNGAHHATTDTTALLHYLAYVIPEADKLHVFDLDAHPGFFRRLNKVRVIFDQVDYKFRVIVKSGTGGWSDVCLQMRNIFKDALKTVIPRKDREISDCWVELVTEFRIHLINFIKTTAKVTEEEVETWLLKANDIRWESTTYSAGGVLSRDLLRESNTDGHWKKPFIISYWADNYLQLDEYKISRSLNGLVGYGEFLYDRNNNYCNRATNNFYTVVNGQKRMFWKDLDVDAKTKNKGTAFATTDDRCEYLEAMIKDNVLHVTNGFRAIVHRRQRAAMFDIEDRAFDAIGLALFPNEPKPDNLYVPSVHLGPQNKYYSMLHFLRHQIVGLVEGINAHPVHEQGDGLLDPDILLKMSKSFINACVDIATNDSDVSEDAKKEMKKKIKVDIRANITQMFKASIHVARETWLLSTYTKNMPDIDFQRMKESYTTDFWEPSLQDSTLLSAAPQARARQIDDNQHTCNNSSLVRPYNDVALKTHALGYTRASRRNNIPTFAYKIGFNSEILQTYFDRKLHSDGVSNFVATADLTSMLRTSHTLIRGFDRFITIVANARTKNGETLIPLVQTTRTPFESQGAYYVLEGADGLFGNVENRYAGKRALHSDDVLTFWDTLCEIVNNPGIWNLLNNSGADLVINAKKDPAYYSRNGPSNPATFNPQAANVGFVNNGQRIEDGPSSDNSSWLAIANMTYTKLRVGIMDQPDIESSSQKFLNFSLNNTRRTSAETMQHAFRSFYFQLYGRASFMQKFQGFSDRNTPIDNVPMHVAIELDSVVLVDEIEMRLQDAGLQVRDPSKPHYAFPNMFASHAISIPTQKHLRLFYYVFGELLYSIVHDLKTAKPINGNKPQMLQFASNRIAADHIFQHIPKFLKNLTEMFFNGGLHQSMVNQLERKRTRTPDVHNPEFDVTKIEQFSDVSDNLLDTLFALRHVQQPDEERRMPGHWHNLSLDAEILRAQIVEMVKNASVSDNNMHDHEAVEHHVHQEVDIEKTSKDEVEMDPATSNITVNHIEKTHLTADKKEVSTSSEIVHTGFKKAFLTFTPFIRVFRKIQKYYERSNEISGRRTKQELSLAMNKEQQQLFTENRMLVMRICEEQMIILERHQHHGEDFQNSLAWEVLFLTFCQMRQKFAQLNVE